MNFKDLTIDNVKTIEKSELLDVLINSIRKMMNINFIKLANHELSKNIYISKYEDIKKEIKYVYEVMNGEKVFKMSIPVIDETKLTKFRTPAFSKKIPNIIPVRNYFIQLDAEIKIMPLGLVEVYFKGFKRPRMDKDYQNLSIIKEYSRTEYLYFNYEENEFKQLVTEEFEDVKIKLNKGKTLNEFLGDQPKDINIRTYLERQEILDIALARINEYADRLQDIFLEFLDDKYDTQWKNGRIARIYGEPVKTSVTSNGIINYINRYGNTLTKIIPNWLKINLIFSNITIKEFERLWKYNFELSEETLNLTTLINQLKLLTHKNNLLRKSQEISFSNINWKDKKGLYIDEVELMNLIIQKLEALEIPKEIRTDKFDKQTPLKGYIYDKETNELYPTLAQMEYRRCLRERFDSKFEDQQYIEQVLKSQMV